MWVDRWSQRVIGAAIAVHSELGPGLLEGLYELCMREELKRAGIPFETQKGMPVRYRGIDLNRVVRIDLIVGSELVVERSTSTSRG